MKEIIKKRCTATHRSFWARSPAAQIMIPKKGKGSYKRIKKERI